MSKEALNTTQLLVNSLKEGINLNTHYCFTPEEAKHVLRVLDLFCDYKRHHIYASFFYNPKVDKTVCLKVFKTNICYPKPLINYQSEEVEHFLKTVKLNRTPEELRSLVFNNFL